MSILEENIESDNLDDREKFWINHYDTYRSNGYNLTKGGDKGNKGYNFTEKQKKKLSKNHKDVSGKNNPRYGVTLSEETKRKISEANKGNKYWLGKKHSQKTKDKISKKMKEKGLLKGINNPKAKVNEQLGEEIYSKYHNNSLNYKDLAEEYSLSKSTIGYIVKGKHWTTNDKNPNIQNQLNHKKVKNIYQEYKNKDITQKQLAEKYNVSSTSVGYIVNKKHSLFRDSNFGEDY